MMRTLDPSAASVSIRHTSSRRSNVVVVLDVEGAEDEEEEGEGEDVEGFVSSTATDAP